jgi:hypothetical protein
VWFLRRRWGRRDVLGVLAVESSVAKLNVTGGRRTVVVSYYSGLQSRD